LFVTANNCYIVFVSTVSVGALNLIYRNMKCLRCSKFAILAKLTPHYHHQYQKSKTGNVCKLHQSVFEPTLNSISIYISHIWTPPSMQSLYIYRTIEPHPHCTVNISHIWTPPSMNSQYITHLNPILNALSLYHTFLTLTLFTSALNIF